MTARQPPAPLRPPPADEPCSNCRRDHNGLCWPIAFWLSEITLGLSAIGIFVWTLT